jgi:class 3 adenylate cyclase
MYSLDYWARAHASRIQLREHEGARSAELLANLLPVRVATLLRNNATVGGDMLAEKHVCVSVLFSDIKGFTEFSANVEPVTLVGNLNLLYTVFDYITTLYDVLKVETIGDAYQLAAGMEGDEDHAARITACGFDMINALRIIHVQAPRKIKHNDTGRAPRLAAPPGQPNPAGADEDEEMLPPLSMRVGVHTGTLVAGIVGRKVPRYHIFGDTVVIANLMESTGEPNHVQVSQATAELLEESGAFPVVYRGRVLTGGQHVHTYWAYRTYHDLQADIDFLHVFSAAHENEVDAEEEDETSASESDSVSYSSSSATPFFLPVAAPPPMLGPTFTLGNKDFFPQLAEVAEEEGVSSMGDAAQSQQHFPYVPAELWAAPPNPLDEFDRDPPAHAHNTAAADTADLLS